MKKQGFIVRFLKKSGTFLLIFVMAIGTVMGGATQTVSAADTGGSLPSDATQSSQVEALGMSADQPDRLSPSGGEVDKSKSPLGPDNVSLNRICQFALSSGENMNVFNTPFGDKRMYSSAAANYEPMASTSAPVANTKPQAIIDNPLWSSALRSMTPADVDGDGKQELAAVGILGTGKDSSLHLLITDYDSLTTNGKKTQAGSKDYVIKTGLNLTPGNTSQILKIAAGDFNQDGLDEIAVSLDGTVYVVKADLSSQKTLSTNNYSTGILGGVPDLQAGDANGDGFPELLVVKQAGASPKDSATLYIYSGTDLAKAAGNIALRFTPSESTTAENFMNPSVCVGDPFGTGDKTILVGGKTKSGKVAMGYAMFYPDTEKYDSALVTGYTVDEKDFAAVVGEMGIKCVSLKTPVPGTPQYVVLGGFIYQFDKGTSAFIRQDVTVSSNTSGLKGNDAKTSHGSLTDVNVKKDKTYILNTLAGNFDGNINGEEQIILLHYNEWYGNHFVYATSCIIDSKGAFRAVMKQVWSSSEKSTYPYPAIAAPDIFNKGTRLVFEPEKSKFMFSNPTVLAVLGATPYYSELEDHYGALGNVGTTYGTESTEESSSSKGVTASVGVSFGYEKGYLFDNIKIGFETEVTNSFAYQWSSAKSITKSISYTNYYSDDAVVVNVIPYDVYYFKSYVYDDKTKQMVESEVTMLVPYSPVTNIMPLTDYNAAAANIKNAPVIDAKVLNHTVGDPRTYQQSTTGLTNVADTDVLTGGSSSNMDENFVAAGTGNNSVDQSIATTTTTGKSFDYALDVNVSFNVNIFGLSAGTSASAGYTRNATISSSSSTVRDGAVASVPQGYEGYNFKWCLAAYNYNLTAGSATQECFVINYLVKPIGTFPPAVPGNFKISARDTSGISFSWDVVDSGAGYKLYRSDSQDGTYTLISDLPGQSDVDCPDTSAAIGSTYYYKLTAYNGKESIPATLTANALDMSKMAVKTQPKLVYDEGGLLDLTNLAVTLTFSDNSTIDYAFVKFPKDLSVSIADKTALAASQTGAPVTVTYSPNGKTASTENLTVGAKSPYDITMSVVFKAGSVNNATSLTAGKPLSASVTLKNNSSSAQQVLVLVVLYSDKGNMVSSASTTSNVSAQGTAKVNIDPAFTLPSNVSGYKVKVFSWDGKSLTSTSLIPKSNVVQLP